MSEASSARSTVETEAARGDSLALLPAARGLWSGVWARFRRNRIALAGYYAVLFLLSTALFADFLANDKPLYLRYNDATHFPILRGYLVDLGLASWPRELVNVDYKKLDGAVTVFPPVPYRQTSVDLFAPLEPPSRKHWFGTDKLGRDVMAGMIHGSRISLSIGFVAVGIAVVIGIGTFLITKFVLRISIFIPAPLLAIAMGDLIPGRPFDRLAAPGVMRWLELALATPVCVWGAWPFFVRAWRSVVNRSLNMFTLIGLGVAVAYGYSVVAVLFPGLFPEGFRDESGEVGVYFEVAAVIVTLILLGQVLELRARSQTGAAIKKLLGLAAKSARRLRDGWYYTGDICRRDAEGFYYICDRKSDMIISGGMNVYPAEIEAALERHPAVQEVAVFGVPSDEWGESVHAAVVARPGLTAEALIDFARARVASYKAPRSVSFIDELPRDYDSRACCATYDTDTRRFEYRRVGYDIETAARKIFESDLAVAFGKRLFLGV